nr:MurR/RpiR family transcriptional regulator [Microlunatus panaciterrae]
MQSRLNDLAPSMRRVAEAILARPEVVMEKTISELAHQCSTSETTIVRFCRAMGLSGYVQLRLALATEIGKETAQRGEVGDHGSDIAEDDSLAAMVAKIAFSETLCIEETLAGLDIDVLQRVVDAIDAASRITLYGVSASGWSADDLQRKLLRIGRVAFAFDDPHDATTSTALLAANDVAIGFSHRGTTTETVHFLQSARQQGATTVAITNAAGSPITAEADLTLLTSVRETKYRSGAMASRIAQLMIVDCIFVGVAQRRFAPTVAALKATYEAVTPLREQQHGLRATS